VVNRAAWQRRHIALSKQIAAWAASRQTERQANGDHGRWHGESSWLSNGGGEGEGERQQAANGVAK